MAAQVAGRARAGRCRPPFDRTVRLGTATVMLLTTLVACNDPYVNIPFKPDPSLWTGACDDSAVDWQNAACVDLSWQPSACAPLATQDSADLGHTLVALPTPLTYADSPPLSGPHRPDWARWGEYAFLPAQRWLYNLEIGGVVVLYNPCTPASLVDGLRQFLRNQPDDDGGRFRWLLTPYPNLGSAFAFLSWRHSIAGNCLDTAALTTFVQKNYRHAPEDSAAAGAYGYAWIGDSVGLLTGPPTGTVPCADASSGDAD